MDMQLNRLTVIRQEYGNEKGKLRGSIEFAGPHGKVEIPLDERLSQEVVRLCSDGIVRISRQVAEELTADVVEGVVALPSPE